jgi:hypothetical protein
MTLAALRAVVPSDASSREDPRDGRDRLTLLLELTNSLELPEARDLLAPVYQRFTEGVATFDLVAAKNLLAAMR